MANMNEMRDTHRQLMSTMLGSAAWKKTDGTTQVENDGLLAGIQQNFSGQIEDMVTQMKTNQATAAHKKELLESLRFYQGQIKDKDDKVGKVDIYFSVEANTPSFDSGAALLNSNGLLGSGDGVSGSFTDQHGYRGTIRDRLYENPKDPGKYLMTTFALQLSNGGISQADAYKKYQEEIDAVEADMQSLSTVSQQQQIKLNEFSNKYTETLTLASNLSKAFYGIALDIARRLA